MSSVPAVYLCLGVIVRDHGVQPIRIVKRQTDVESLLCVQVERIIDRRRRGLDVTDQIEQTTGDDSVAVFTMSHRYVPRFLDGQAVSVQLGDEQKVAFFLGRVDHPQTVLVDGQVEVVVVSRI